MKAIAGILGMAVLAVVLMGGVFWTHGGATHPVAKTAWAETQVVAHIGADSGKMLDSCVPPHPFDLPTHRPTAC